MRRAMGTAVGLLMLSACATATFEPLPASAVPDAITSAGGQVCEQGTATANFPGETSATSYSVSTDCSSPDPGLVVGEVRFDSEQDRNAALSLVRHRMRRLSNHYVLTFGDAVITLTQFRDASLAEDVANALRDEGAA